MNRIPFIGFNWDIQGDKVILSQIYSDCFSNAEIKAGDTLIIFAGIRITDNNKTSWYWEAIKEKKVQANESIPARFERNGQPIITKITPVDVNYWLNPNALIGNIQFLFFLILSIYIVIFKFRLLFNRFLIFIFLGCAILFCNMYYPVIMIHFSDIMRKILFRSSFLIFPILLHFTLIFPNKKLIITKLPQIIYILYIPSCIFLVYDIAQELYNFIFLNGIYKSWFVQLEWDRPIRVISGLIYITLSIALIIHTYRKTSLKKTTSDLEWVLGGIIVGIIPVFLLNIISYLQNHFIILNQFFNVTVLLLMSFPIPFLIGIVKYNIKNSNEKYYHNEYEN